MAVNKARGEVAFEADGKAIALALNLGALAALEDAFSTDSYEDVFADLLGADKMSASKFRKMLVTVAEANGQDIEAAIDAMMPDDMAALAMDLMRRAFPEPDAKKKGRAVKNP